MKNVAEIVVKWKFYDLKSIIFHHIINHHTNKKADNWILLKPSVLGYGDTTFHQKFSLNSQKCGHEMVKATGGGKTKQFFVLYFQIC